MSAALLALVLGRRNQKEFSAQGRNRTADTGIFNRISAHLWGPFASGERSRAPPEVDNRGGMELGRASPHCQPLAKLQHGAHTYLNQKPEEPARSWLPRPRLVLGVAPLPSQTTMPFEVTGSWLQTP